MRNEELHFAGLHAMTVGTLAMVAARTDVSAWWANIGSAVGIITFALGVAVITAATVMGARRGNRTHNS